MALKYVNTSYSLIRSLTSCRHYQDAYTTLMIMFGSTAILPPRTKRWAEAKVLADTINFKVRHTSSDIHQRSSVPRSRSSTSTTMNTPSPSRITTSTCAVSPTFHAAGVSAKRHSSTGAGWHDSESDHITPWVPSLWTLRHRVLAELLEQGSRSTLVFPTHTPLARASGAPLASAVGPGSAPLDMDAVRTLGLNPSHALQHPGHYYYMAARCTEARRERFLVSESASQGVNAPPGYTNEKKVDHLTIVLEVYSILFSTGLVFQSLIAAVHEIVRVVQEIQFNDNSGEIDIVDCVSHRTYILSV